MSLNYSVLQPYIILISAVYASFVLIATIMLKFQSKGCKKALALAEFSCVCFLVSDAISLLFDNQPTPAAHTITVISNFLVFSLVEVQLIFYNLYITYSFMETGKFRKLPKHLLAGFILPCICITLILISQFTGLCYYIDENNVYHRGPLYLACVFFPLLIMTIQIMFVVRYRMYLRERRILSIEITICFFVIAGALQTVFPHVAFNDYAALFGCLNMFLLSIVDQNEILIKSANTDVASGLPNTYGYISDVDKLSQTEDITNYNAYYIDIVRMGRINSVYGKALGDEVIKRYGKYVRAKLAKNEIFGRLGGDFFVALVRREHTDSFLQILSDVPVSIKTETGKDELLHISAVAGIYEFESKKTTAGMLISGPAEALYYAKNVYKKPYVYLDKKLKDEIDERRSLEEALSHAIEDKEFIAYYQPKVNAQTHHLCGAEALVRWKHEGKLVAPYKFIPILERNEKICQVDFWVLSQVCRDISLWIEDGFNPPPVSVNFSRRHLGNPKVADEIIAVIERNDIPKSLIDIEITETIDEYPISVLKEFVEKLQSKGVRVAIDDFGTGSSSLNLIHRIHFDILKIDRALVDIQNETGKALLSRTIELSKHLGMDVIAEGVETEEQLEFIKQTGCEEIQGFIFDKPLEKFEYEQRMIRKLY